jgi:high-affinity nickel-transport protein
MTITLISVLVALIIGGIEALGILQGQLNLTGGFWSFVATLTSGTSFGWVGLGIILIFALSWLLSTLIYRIKKYDDLDVKLRHAP